MVSDNGLPADYKFLQEKYNLQGYSDTEEEVLSLDKAAPTVISEEVTI